MNTNTESTEATELQNTLQQFIGTEAYHPWSILFRNMVLTDGAKYVADTAGAYWLMDIIGSYLPLYKSGGFAVADLRKQGSGWRVTIGDGNDTVLTTQDIEYSDFPLDEVKFYVTTAHDGLWVIMLPSEY